LIFDFLSSLLSPVADTQTDDRMMKQAGQYASRTNLGLFRLMVSKEAFGEETVAYPGLSLLRVASDARSAVTPQPSLTNKESTDDRIYFGKLSILGTF
jgi:hypothetical protein